MYQYIKTILTHGFSRPILSNSIKIALIVGTILNAINQGERILARSEIFWESFFLNYLIPFCVSCYSASCHAMHLRMRQAIETMLPGNRAQCISPLRTKQNHDRCKKMDSPIRHSFYWRIK